ncbi:MAG TPA: hypothetical protein VFR85_08100 [Anaeromyxobacteraceae bacterium]|nr:hypothetical protein [Anaeromyxobacteraceae bacterium]
MRAMAAYPEDRRIQGVGVCGTDREIAAFRCGTPPGDGPYQAGGVKPVVVLGR